MKVKFVPQNIELEIRPGQSVLDLAQQNDIHIQSVCKGIPSCAECRVYVKEGEHNVMPPQSKELELIGTAYFVDQRRLSCQLRCFGDVTVDLSEQIAKQQKSSKNPQGRYVKEREDSHARMGNLLEELTEEEMALAKQEAENSLKEAQKQKLDSGAFYKNVEKSEEKSSDVRNSQKSQLAAKQNHVPKSSDKQNAQELNRQSRKNRNRRRNKNRNKNSNHGGNQHSKNPSSNT